MSQMRKSWRTLGVGLLVGLMVFAAGCGSKSSTPPGSPSTAAGAGSAGTPTPTRSIRSGLLVGNLGSLVETLPDVQQQYNVAFDIKLFRDSTAAMLALDQGELEMANTTSQHIVRAIDEGMDLVLVAGYGGGNNTLVIRSDLPVATDDWAALRTMISDRKQAGRLVKIGVPTGSMQHQKLHFALVDNGIDPDKDVQIVNIPFAEHPRALEAGELDLAMSVAVFAAMSIDSGKGKLFHHLYGGEYGKQEIGFLVQGKTIRDNPQLVQDMVSAIVDAEKRFKDDVEKQIALEVKYTNLPESVLKITQGQLLTVEYRINIADIEQMAKEMYQIGWVKEDYSAKIKDFVDLSFLAKATGLTEDQLSKW